MSTRIVWKLLLAALVFGFALVSLFPLTDRPFDAYLLDEVPAAQQEEASALLEKARARVDSGEAANLYAGFKMVVQEEEVDVQELVPHINARDIANVGKRNDILLSVLLERSQGQLRPGLDLQGGVAFTFKIDQSALEDNPGARQSQLAEAREVIAERVDGLGVAEPVIRLKGEDRIEVQMPGLRNEPGVQDAIAKPAVLEFAKVHRTLRPGPGVDTPVGYRAMTLEEEDPRTGAVSERDFFVKRVPDMRGEAIADAFPTQNQYGGFQIALNFTSDGAKRFGDLTTEIYEEDQRTGSRGLLATILDGKLVSALGINEPILGGRAQITGSFTQREAVELSNILNNPLEVGLELESLYEVGPTLARDAREASLQAALWGAVAVVVFMVLYYGLAGVISMVSVSLAIVIVMGLLASFGATLTLPGVAALVLTIGMAVDANILIFERMREEVKEGKSLPAGLQAGYAKALSTIVDANVTTMITALILIWLGSGPVKGFGVTLAVGIGASVFCALVVSRLFLELVIHSGMVRKMMRVDLLGKLPRLRFLNYSRPAFFASWIIVIIGVVMVAIEGDEVLGIDFTGGDEITVTYEELLTSQDVSEVAATNDLGEVQYTRQTLLGTDQEVLRLQAEVGQGRPLYDALVAAYPDAGLALAGETTIGPAVGASVQWSALLSIGVALLGMLLYIAFRFEVGYGMGAVVATVHDILMTIGLYVVLGGEFSAPMVAAILMVVGYSINDTIVVFDRIREELDLHPDAKLRDVVHIAINRTLSRTLLTSVTTLLATIMLCIFGAGVVTDFATVFLIGILTGTFSSIFIASPVFYWWHKGDRKHVEERHDVLPKYDWEVSTKAAQE